MPVWCTRIAGLTPEQIRARLRATGYPDSLLNAYLGTAAPGEPLPIPGAQEMAAVQALGLGQVIPTAEVLRLDTGAIRTRAAFLRADLRRFAVRFGGRDRLD